MDARTLPLLAAAHAGGILLADAGWLPRDVALLLGLHALALALGVPALRAPLAAVVLLAAGAAHHGAHLEAAVRDAPASPREATIEGRLARREVRGSRFRIELREVRPAGATPAPVPRALWLYQEATPPGRPALEARTPGSRIRARVRVRPVHGLRNPGGADRALRARRLGIGAEGRLAHPALHAGVRPAPAALRAWHRLRDAALGRLLARGEGGGLLAALALGEGGALAPETRRAFARLGVSHLLAVSGLHLALVAGLVFAAVRRAGARSSGLCARTDPRRLALAAAVLAGGLYALLTGPGVPARRAALLLGVGAAAVWRRRPTPRAPALAAAALLVLLAEPAALFAPGAQLSFAATAALLHALPTRREGAPETRRARLAAWLRETALASAAALAVTAPLAALHFGVAAPLALVANLVAVPLAAFLLLPCALSSALVAAFVAGPVGEAWLDAAAAGAEGLLALGTAAAAEVPAREAGSPAWPALLLALLLAWPALRARALALRLAAAALGSLLLALAPPARFDPPPPRAVFLDVGAGDAVLVQGRRAALLVDAGAAIPGGIDLGAAAVVPALRALGVQRLDLVVASHADLDHRGGLPAVLEAMPVARLWVPHGGLADPGLEALRVAARRRSVPVRERGGGDPPLRIGDLRVVPLWPPPSSGAGASRNDRSLVLRVDAPRARLLLPGDLEARGERALRARTPPDMLRAEILKLPHHGSATSSTGTFLDAVRPRLAVASAPRFPRHPMPAPEVRARLAERGVRLRWTGRDGAVLVSLAEAGRVRTLREREDAAAPP